MQQQTELLQEIFIAASCDMRLSTLTAEAAAVCQADCNGVKCGSVQSEDKLPDNFYA